MDQSFLDRLRDDTEDLKAEGLYKAERVITSPQQSRIRVGEGKEVIDLEREITSLGKMKTHSTNGLWNRQA